MNLWTSNMLKFLKSINERDIANSKKSDSIPLASHEDSVSQDLRSVDFTNDLWTSQSKNEGTLDPNLCESKNSDQKRDISRSYTPKHENLWDTQFDLRDSQKFLIVIEVTNESNNRVPSVRCAPSSLGDIAVSSFGQNPWSQKGPILRRYHAPNRPSMEGKDLSPDFVFCTKWKFYSRAIRRYAYLDQGVSEQKVPSVWTFFRHKIGKDSRISVTT